MSGRPGLGGAGIPYRGRKVRPSGKSHAGTRLALDPVYPWDRLPPIPVTHDQYQAAAADRGRTTVVRGTTVSQRPRLLSFRFGQLQVRGRLCGTGGVMKRTQLRAAVGFATLFALVI